MKWTNLPDEPGTWFKFYRGSFQACEYFVMGTFGLEYSRIPGCKMDLAIEGMRWLGPVPHDDGSVIERTKGDVK